jgi:hypothetical protein
MKFLHSLVAAAIAAPLLAAAQVTPPPLPPGSQMAQPQGGLNDKERDRSFRAHQHKLLNNRDYTRDDSIAAAGDTQAQVPGTAGGAAGPSITVAGPSMPRAATATTACPPLPAAGAASVPRGKDGKPATAQGPARAASAAAAAASAPRTLTACDVIRAQPAEPARKPASSPTTKKPSGSTS